MSSSETYPAPTPWYDTQEGETLIAIGGIALAGLAYAVTVFTDVTGMYATAVSLVGLLGFGIMLVFSGRAATRAVGEMMEGSR